MEGSKPTHGKGNRVLHPEPLSEERGVGSPAKVREGNRVLHTSKEVGIAYGSAKAKPLFVYHQKTAEPSPCGTFPTVTLAGGYSVCAVSNIPLGVW